MYLGQWDVSLDPIDQTVLTDVHIMQRTIVHNCSIYVTSEIVCALNGTPLMKEGLL